MIVTPIRSIVLCCVVAVVGVASASAADDVFRPVQSPPEPRQITYPCKCEESQCRCCAGNVLQNFNFNFRQRLCTNIAYSPEDFEFNVRILFNDYTIYNRVVSGRNPRPVCVPIFPPAWTQSRVCLKFSNVYFVGRNVHVCLSLEAQTEKKPVFAADFNCVRLGTAGVALLKPEDGGGLPPPIPPQDSLTSPAAGASTATAAATAEEEAETETARTFRLPGRKL